MESRNNFQAFLDEEVKKVKGIYMPVRTSIPRRMLTRHTSLKRLHPNPMEGKNHRPGQEDSAARGKPVIKNTLSNRAGCFSRPFP